MDEDEINDHDTIAVWERGFEGPVNSEGRVTLRGAFDLRYVRDWLVFPHPFNIRVVA